MTDRALILTIMAAYLLACVGIGIWSSRRTRSAADFFVAGKSIGVWVYGIATFSTLLSGFGFIGGPGLVYEYGTSSFWICLPAIFGFVLSALLVNKRLWVFAQIFDVLTLPDAVEARYESRICRLLAALVILLGVVGYLGVQILAFGMIAESFFGIHPTAAILVGVTVIIFYAVTGGIVASLYTDLLQGSLMIFASLGVFIAAMWAAGDGSVTEAPSRITEAFLASETPEFVGPWGLMGPMLCLSWFFVFVLGGTGQPHVITKNLMIRNASGLRWGLLVSSLCYAMCTLLWIGVGMSMRYLVLTGQEPALSDPDHAAPRFLLNHTPAWLAGIVFAGLFSAIMSTADAFLNLGAAVCVRDIPRAILGRSVKRELLWARIATVITAAAATAFALTAGDLVALVGIFSWGTFAAALVPTVAIGFNWKRATWQAAAAAMVTGIALHLGLEVLKRYPSPEEPVYGLPYGVDTGAVALMASITVFIAVSLLTPRPRLSRKLETAIDV